MRTSGHFSITFADGRKYRPESPDGNEEPKCSLVGVESGMPKCAYLSESFLHIHNGLERRLIKSNHYIHPGNTVLA